MWVSDAQLDAFHRERAHRGRWVQASQVIGMDMAPDWLPSDIPKYSSGGSLYLFLEGSTGERVEVENALRFIAKAKASEGPKTGRRRVR